jgi:hypothetical protein
VYANRNARPTPSSQTLSRGSAKKEPPEDAKQYDGVDGKFEKFFSEKPGEGD